MGFISKAIDFVLHADRYINWVIQNYGIGVYAFLFLIIFVETGLVIMPFLPGDSLIFIAGTFAANGLMNIWILFAVFFLAAVLGDTVNYWIGNYFGEKVFEKSRFFKKEYLEQTKEFYAKHGGKTIILARFVPIIRTFAPFVAGVGKMKYRKFIIYNVIGAFLWVSLFLTIGYYFGNIPWVKENLMMTTYILIVVSFIPPIYSFLKYRRAYKKKKKASTKLKRKDLE
ncbi:MAG: DedA family protein [Candidatus Nanoarchaeia archaeon]